MDGSGYLIGDRMLFDIAQTQHVTFTTGQSLWRFTTHVAGRPWLSDKVTLTDGTTVSPFVALSA
jgi:hypothetical protein